MLTRDHCVHQYFIYIYIYRLPVNILICTHTDIHIDNGQKEKHYRTYINIVRFRSIRPVRMSISRISMALKKYNVRSESTNTLCILLAAKKVHNNFASLGCPSNVMYTERSHFSYYTRNKTVAFCVIPSRTRDRVEFLTVFWLLSEITTDWFRICVQCTKIKFIIPYYYYYITISPREIYITMSDEYAAYFSQSRNRNIFCSGHRIVGGTPSNPRNWIFLRSYRTSLDTLWSQY